MQHKNIFIDTNLFLQCSSLDQLPWSEIEKECDLILYIPRVALKELDKLKYDGNSRRANRARKATSLFREIISLKDEKKTIRFKDPKVEITFAPHILLSKELETNIDICSNDDKLIAEITAFRENIDEAILLTNDTILMVTAKHYGIKFILIPDSWLLPPEPDDRDRRISELESQIKELSESYPKIETEFKLLDEEANNDHAIVAQSFSIFN
jgi:predicted nucleic acid-binding protein